MSEPFARRKEKKPEYEEPPIIYGGKPPSRTPPARAEGEPTRSDLQVSPDSTDVFLRQRLEHEKVIRPGDEQMSFETAMVERAREGKQDIPIIYGPKAPPRQLQPAPERPTPESGKLIDHVDLTGAQARTWAEPGRSKEKVIRGK